WCRAATPAMRRPTPRSPSERSTSPSRSAASSPPCSSCGVTASLEFDAVEPDVLAHPLDDAATAPEIGPEAPLFVCRGLTYAYLERFPALESVDLEVRKGEKVALLGANGCGKSTLLKILDGLMFPDTGTFAAFGEEVTEDNLEDEQFAMGFRSRVGFIFQNSD